MIGNNAPLTVYSFPEKRIMTTKGIRFAKKSPCTKGVDMIKIDGFPLFVFEL